MTLNSVNSNVLCSTEKRVKVIEPITNYRQQVTLILEKKSI